MTTAEAVKSLGVSANGNTKMNCPTWGLPVSTCHKHHPESTHSTCNKKNCYAQRGFYCMESVQLAQKRRLWRTVQPAFTKAFSAVFARYDHFRLFDAGDFPEIVTMHRIMMAAKQNQNCHIYAPTKKYELLEQYLKTYDIPDNVCIRPGHWKLDAPAEDLYDLILRFGTTSVVSKRPDLRYRLPDGIKGHVCRALDKNVRCLIDCDACWDKKVRLVVYPWH